jgi:hypothetical protein
MARKPKTVTLADRPQVDLRDRPLQDDLQRQQQQQQRLGAEPGPETQVPESAKTDAAKNRQKEVPKFFFKKILLKNS